MNTNSDKLSVLGLANVEALADPEVDFDSGDYWISNVTTNSHTCTTGGPFSCNI